MNLLWQCFCVLALGLACWTAGSMLYRRLFDVASDLPRTAGRTLSFAAGNVVLSYVLTALGFIGLLGPLCLWVFFLGGIGLALWRVLAPRWIGKSVFPGPKPESASDPGSTLTRGIRDRLPQILLIITIVFFLIPMLFHAAAPPYVRDTLVYHLLCPKEYLKAHRLVHIEGNLYSVFPKGQEVLMTVLLAVAGDRAAQGFSILQNLGAAGALFCLVRQAAGPWSAMVCTLGFATLPPVVYFTGCGYVEPAFLLAFGSSLLTWAIYKKRSGVLAEGARLRMLGFLGLLAGWIPALKYNGLIYFGLIGLGILWQERKGPTGQSLLRCGMFGLAALPGFNWMIWNWIALGNPVYPLAWFLFGGAGWDEVRALSYSRYFDLFGMGRTFSDYLLLPWRFAFSGKFDSMLFDGAAGPFLLVFTFLAAASMTPWVNRRAPCFFRKELGWMFLVSAAFFVFGTQQARFWLPSQLLACSLAAPAVEIWVRVKSGWIRSGLGLIMIACLVWNGVYLGRQIALVAYYRPVLGSEKEEDFLARKVGGFPAIQFLNRNLSQASRCLCVWTGVYGYYIERPYYSDTFVEDATLKELIQASTDGKDLARRLVDARFTHLYVHLPLLLRNLDPRQLALFSDFVKRGASEVYHHQDFHVFAILKQ